VIQIANAHMARALRVISVERGHDPRDFTLLSFGGAGGLHAGELARNLGIRRILIPAAASTLSAFGMLAAEVVRDYVQTVMLSGDTPIQDLEDRLAQLAQRGKQEVAAEGIPAERIRLEKRLDVRYVGQSYELSVPLSGRFKDDFLQAHRQTYGHSDPQAPIEIVNLRLKAIGAVDPPSLPVSEPGSTDPSSAQDGERTLVLTAPDANGALLGSVRLYLGQRLHPGHQILGPAIVSLPDTTVFLNAGDRATMDPYRNLRIEIDDHD
jgi:N-methylhydantoinase A